MSEDSAPMRVGHTEIVIRLGPEAGDITRVGADVLVSSEGTDAAMASGVSLAIHSAGGDEILHSLQTHQPLVPGDVVITSAGDLPAKNIYHAVVVGWGDKRLVLQASVWRAVTRCMELAQLTNMTSLAFPSLGTGTAAADRYETHSTMSAACLDSLRPDTSLRRIYFCFIDPDTGQNFRTALLQQRLIRQARGVSAANKGEQDQLKANLDRLWPAMLDLHVNVDKLAGLVTQLEHNPSPQTINNYIVGNITNSIGVAIGPAQATVTQSGVATGPFTHALK